MWKTRKYISCCKVELDLCKWLWVKESCKIETAFTKHLDLNNVVRKLLKQYQASFLAHWTPLFVRRAPFCSDNVTRVKDFWLESRFWWLDSSHVKKRCWLDPSHVLAEWPWSTRITINYSRLELESFLQNLQTSDWQTKFLCTQRNELFMFQWWSILAQILSFDCFS